MKPTSIEDAKKRNEDTKMAAAAQAFDRAQAQRVALVDAHLKRLAEDHAENGQMLITVVQAEIKAGRVTELGTEAFADHCETLAARLVTAQRKREWVEIKALLDANNVRNPHPVMIAAAKRSGVELSQVIVPDAPKLVQE